MHYFAPSPIDRTQTVIDLDQAIGQDHTVRLLDEFLRTLDWSDWESPYHGRRGQPPIPPRILAALLLYGMFQGFRTSRTLEYLCQHNLDFMWLAEGFQPDHSTFCKFRTRFQQPLKRLFRQIGHAAIAMGVLKLGQLALDGTRGLANNNRGKTDTAPKLQRKLQQLQQEIDHKMDAWFEQHCQESQQAAQEEPPLRSMESTRLPDHLATLQQRKAALEKALQEVQQMDAARQKQGIDPQKNPAQRCRTDPDAKVMSNKEGGYAPNFTPLAGVDVDSGLILYNEVIAGVDEHNSTLAAVDQVEQDFGQGVEIAMADSAFATGENLKGMEERGVTFYTPILSSQPQEGNPALRDDPTQPVAQEQWDALPRNPKGQLDKSAFVYDPSQDVYYCPNGQTLEYEQTKTETRQGQKVERRVYRCAACAGCPLAGLCLNAKNKKGRTINRDQYEEYRERAAARMASEEGKKIYARRFHAGEAPFGILKAIMGLRRFLLRGLEKVRQEWRWACTAYNVKKLLRWLAAQRAAGGANPLLALARS